MTPRIHPTALIEQDVRIGSGSAIWDHAHVRHGTEIGEECIIGGKTYIAYDVRIGNRVKINASVYVCTGVTIEDGVMIGAGTIFTNDRFPRATTTDLRKLRPSEPDEHTLPTLIREGATLGAGCIVGNDLQIGRFAMVGMGSLVTRSVPDFHLVYGHPAASTGCVCRCGQPLLRFAGGAGGEIVEVFPDGDDSRPLVDRSVQEITCPICSLPYSVAGRDVIELSPPS